ncbi:MAG: hypothetical protein Q9164_001005 [Protoblastenia rupestris]
MPANGQGQARCLTHNCGKESPTIINLDCENEYESDATLQDDDFEERIIAPTPAINADTSSNIAPDPEYDAIFRVVPDLRYDGSTLRAGKTIELKDGDFLRITLIVERRDTKETVIRGLRFRRNTLLDGFFEKKKNEVALLLQYSELDSRDIMRQSTQSVRLHEIVKIRQLVKTNQQFPKLSYHEINTSSAQMGNDWNSANGRLVCRWKLLYPSNNAGLLQSLTEDECDKGQGVKDEALRFNFRGRTIKGGSCPRWTEEEEHYNRQERIRCNYRDPLLFYGKSHPVMGGAEVNSTAENMIDLTIDQFKGRQRYTFGDGFCGAG